MSESERNKARVVEFWKRLYEDRDYDAVGEFFAADGLYQDVPTPDFGAVGPENVAKRLRIGLEPIEKHEHETHRIVAEGDTVITEHTEHWYFHTGEKVSLPFVSVQTFRDDKITLWRDYFDLNTLMSNAPPWWIERLAKFTQEDFAD